MKVFEPSHYGQIVLDGVAIWQWSEAPDRAKGKQQQANVWAQNDEQYEDDPRRRPTSSRQV